MVTISPPSLSRRHLALAASAIALVLVIALATASSPVAGSGLRSIASQTAGVATAQLSQRSTLAGIAPQITKRFSTPSAAVSVLDTHGHTLSLGSASRELTPAVSPLAIRASLVGSDVRLTARDGSGETASVLAPVRSKGRAVGVVVASGPIASSSSVGTGRAGVILIAAALLGGLGFLAGRARAGSVPGQRGRADATEPGRRRNQAPEPASANFDRLVKGLVELEEIAPGGVFLERIQMTLTDAGIETDDPAGQPFDSRLYRAVQRLDTRDPQLHNTVAHTIRPGYRYGGQVLRPAEVAVYRQVDG